MLGKIKEQLGSGDEALVKQAITLLLDLGLAEETEQEFGLLLDDSDEDYLQLIAGDELISLLTNDESWDDDSSENSSINSDLIEACLLALLIASGRIGKHVKSLVLSPNPYFEELDLLDRLEGIEKLKLDHFEGARVIDIISKIESLCILHLVGVNDLSHFMEIENLDDILVQCRRIIVEGVDVSKVIESVSQLQVVEKVEVELKSSSIDIKWLLSITDDEDILETLEKVTEHQEIFINDKELEALLALEEIEWGVDKKRWMTVCTKLRMTGVKRSSTIEGIKMKMVYCPAGEFWMGSNDGYGGEQPRHKVKISQGFWMGQTQVTQELWHAVMGNNPSYFKGKQLPVEKVSWFDCVRFCNRLSELEGLNPVYKIDDFNDPYDDSNTEYYYESGEESRVDWDRKANGYRLPTEAEWEYASKAGTELIYAGSNDIDEVAWYEENSEDETHPVAQLKPNTWGLYDCSGNVDEWCNDLWDDSAYKNRTGTTVDPCVYDNGAGSRSVRGGLWVGGTDGCRVAYRSWDVPGFRNGGLGFRLSRHGDA